MTRKKVVKKKIEIVFDPQKRKEFLTGFRKRKNERRKRAKEDLERNLKEERKRIRLEIKDGIKHMKRTYEPLKELTEEDKAKEVAEEEYEDDEVKVKIVELSTGELARSSNFLGENQADESEEEASADNEDETDTEQNVDCVPGMDFDAASKKRRLKRAKEAETATQDGPRLKKQKKTPTELKTKKELDRMKKKMTNKKLNKSDAFKMKRQFEKKANQKKAQRDKNNTLKSLPKYQQKKKKNHEPKSRYRKGRMLSRKERKRAASSKE